MIDPDKYKIKAIICNKHKLNIQFDDVHNTGIYTWPYLRKISEDSSILYKDYLERVAKISSI